MHQVILSVQGNAAVWKPDCGDRGWQDSFWAHIASRKDKVTLSFLGPISQAKTDSWRNGHDLRFRRKLLQIKFDKSQGLAQPRTYETPKPTLAFPRNFVPIILSG